MGCIIITETIKEYAKQFPRENVASISNALGMWWEANPTRAEELPTPQELNLFINDMRSAEAITAVAPTSQQAYDITYIPKGKTKQNYTIVGTKIYNKQGKEVFSKDSVDRYKIFAKLAVQQGRAVIVEYKDSKYIVNNRGQILSVQTGKIMKWEDNNSDKKAIINLSKDKLEYTNTAYQILDEALIPEASKEEMLTIPEDIAPLSERRLPVTTPPTEVQKVDLVFDPAVRRDRVSLIARHFSKKVDKILEEKKALLDKIMMERELSVTERNQLKEELYSLNRMRVIREITPKGIFDKVKKSIFEEYLNLSEEAKIKVELIKINKAKGADKYSDEKKLEAARQRATYKAQEYQKIVDYFDILAEEASSLLLTTEKIRVNPNFMAPSEGNVSESDNTGSDAVSNEENIKDNWMTYFREVSSFDSLSQAVRKIIREIPALDYRGKYAKDDLGNQRYLDADYVHATLIDKLKDMITSEDMLPLLRELAKIKPWVNQIINILEKDDVIFSQFYQDFRKDFIEYWVQKKITKPDGSFEYQTISINRPEGVSYLFDSWRDNYDSGILLDDDSIYNQDRSINKENATKGLNLVDELINTFNKLSTEERLKAIDDKETWNKIIKLLHMIGVDPNPGVLKVALTNIKKDQNISYTDPIMVLLPQLKVIFDGISRKNKIKSETLEDGTVIRGDLINTFSGAYGEIASLLSEVIEDAIESSTRENGKSYYAHVKPSYIGKLMKLLKNSGVRTEKDFKDFIESEFKQYEWFYKDGKWRNDWIRQLVENPSLRKALKYKVLLNSDKVEYTDWNSLDYMLVLYNEYNAEPEEKMAWYYLPILSDAPSAEFIRFTKYTNGSEIDKQGNKLSYKQSITKRLIDLINQEYDRMMLVREREELRKKGELKDKDLIKSFDIAVSSDGKGGNKFCFLPALNDYIFENGETFLARFERLREGSPSKFRQFLEETVLDFMETEFEAAYRKWVENGLLTELDSGQLKYLKYQGPSKINALITKSLIRAKGKLGNLFTPEMETVLSKYSKNKPVDDRQATAIFNKIKEALNNKVLSGEITDKDFKDITKNLTTKNNAKESLREYFWNNTLATSQIIQLTTTDLAYYKNLEDFQKRFKEVHSPSLRLNTTAKFQGELVGRKIERSIYIADEKIKSTVYGDIKELLDIKVEREELTSIDRDYILSQYRKVNVTDAQSFRSLSSYRAVMVMSGQWTDEMEAAYKKLNDPKGKWTITDFAIIWQTKKPFVYTQVNVDSKTSHGAIKSPVQHKNSEFLLLAIYDAISGPLGKSSKLKAINDFMEKHQIDVVHFNSVVKTGEQGTITLSGDMNYETTKRVLENETGIANGQEDPSVIHSISYEDYGIQVETPEHAIDHEQVIGTQIRKLIAADIPDTAEITVEGVKMTKVQWVELYNAINVENILDSFKSIDELFANPDEVERILQEEISGNARYGADLAKSCKLNKETGEFDDPLYDPVQSNRIQTILNSIIKNTVTKQKIKGGSVIQVSSFGYTDQLSIVWEGTGENKRIKYLECYMPAYSRQFFEPLMDNNGQLDITKLPEDLRKFIGYRVPTENKYSMLPLYIKGFLPQANGSAIMLPADITTITGSDFDIDKLYIMLYEFTINKYDYRRAAKDFELSKDIMQSLSEMFKEGNPFESITNIPLDFKEWFSKNKENYKLDRPIVRKLKYDYGKKPEEQSRKARNNAIIDMMWGILTNPNIASMIITPGGFEKQSKAARISTILEEFTEEDLIREGGYVPEYLLKLSLDKLDKLVSKVKPRNPLSPITQVELHQQNMTGKKMIGVYANHNANHALMQYTKLAVSPYGEFTYAGRKVTSLHNIKTIKGELITINNSNYLSASVDNVKDNTLYATNQNLFTGDASMLLSRLGYNPTEIAILMNQPIVKEITKRYFRESREGKSAITIIDEVINETKKWAGMYEDLSFKNVSEFPFDLVPLMRAIMQYKNIDKLSEKEQRDFYRTQVTVGLLFKGIRGTGEALGNLVQATKADTQNGGAGPTIADTLIKTKKVADLIVASSKEKYPLMNADIIRDDIIYDGNIDVLRKKLLESPLPYLQAFYTLGVKLTEGLLSKYFPYFRDNFKEVLTGKYDKQGNQIFKGLADMTRTGRLDVKTINSIYNDLFAYILSKTEFFGSERDINGNIISAEEKRLNFIRAFPKQFEQILEENPDIAEVEFIQRLTTKRAGKKTPIDVLVFRNAGSLNATLRETYMRDWTTLLHMKNPVANRLAYDLFLYSYFRNGFAFGPNSFIHLAPIEVRSNIPGYMETLKEMLKSTDSFVKFIEQYIYNHLDNTKFVPKIPEKSTVEFTDENNNIKEEVIFYISETSKSEDKTVVKEERTDTLGETTYTFMEFIGKRIRGRDYYYRLSEATPTSALYTRIEPLGYKHNFLEYEWDKWASEINTVIDKNKKYLDPLAEYSAAEDTIPDLDDRDYYIENDYSMQENIDSLLSKAYELIYEEPMDDSPIFDDNDITSMEPNENYTDANDETICG